MILDQFKNLSQYEGIPELRQAIKFVCTHNIAELPLGRTEIDGERLFCNIQEYASKTPEEVQGEAHRKYIDFQCILSGEEKIGYFPLDQAGEALEEHPEKDIWFYRNTKGTELMLYAGMFAVFYPQDMHIPCQVIDKSVKVKKAVFKIRI